MKLQTGYITTVRLPVNTKVQFVCSKCNKRSVLSHKFYIKGEAVGSLISNPIKRKQNAVSNLMKKKEKIVSQIAKHDYRNINLHCTCSHCGNKEVWAKYIFPDLFFERYNDFMNKGGTILYVAIVLALTILITNIFKPPISVILFIIALLSVPLCPISVVFIKNHFVQKKVDKLEDLYYPEITIDKDANILISGGKELK